MTRLDERTLLDEMIRARATSVDRNARRLLRWAHELLGDQLMMTTSFQKSGMILLHMLRDVAPDLPVYFLDTGFHFPETLAFAERIRRDWGVRVLSERPALFGDAFRARHGDLYERDPDRCCHLNKVEPQQALLARHQGWITGVRRDQAATREGIEPLELLAGGTLKIQPLALWTRADVDAYLEAHDIPLHPLFARGYRSIGCAPCTQPCNDPANERAGRWQGRNKVECGLHTFWQRSSVAAARGPASGGPGDLPS